jgi:membrane protein
MARHRFRWRVITVLIAMLYKWLPNKLIAWRDVWIGAFSTAVLFTFGQLAMGCTLDKQRLHPLTVPRAR